MFEPDRRQGLRHRLGDRERWPGAASQHLKHARHGKDMRCWRYYYARAGSIRNKWRGFCHASHRSRGNIERSDFSKVKKCGSGPDARYQRARIAIELGNTLLANLSRKSEEKDMVGRVQFKVIGHFESRGSGCVEYYLWAQICMNLCWSEP